MTRINLVDPSVLHRKHLVAELHELPRIFTLARNAQFEVIRGKKKIPQEYTLGTGHCLFFYDKLSFLADRYELLCSEMRARNYSVNQIDRTELLVGIDSRLLKSYTAISNAIAINAQRISDRTKPHWK